MNVNTGDVHIGNLTINVMNDTSTHCTSDNLAEQFAMNQRAAEGLFQMVAAAQEVQRVREARAEQERQKRRAEAAALQKAKQATYHARILNHIKYNMPELHCMFPEGKFK
ncbi:hypothetical protein V8U11_16015 [Pseudomonas chlororaphis]|uniref:hypothetical protein n=1 Tax=Pseudomonas chlororaphis TaxID=587753 RepID=UPI0030CBBFE6